MTRNKKVFRLDGSTRQKGKKLEKVDSLVCNNYCNFCVLSIVVIDWFGVISKCGFL